tara:strand:- start:1 stop:297 length:297 start_codon:yes stop_codon:yes gene_type:complete
MSHAHAEITPVLLNPGGAADDIAADEVRTFWTAADQDCTVQLSDGSIVVSARAAPDTAATVKAQIQARIANGQSPVLSGHMDALGLREAVEEWAREGL